MQAIRLEADLKDMGFDQHLSRRAIDLGDIAFDTSDILGQVFDDDLFARPAGVLRVNDRRDGMTGGREQTLHDLIDIIRRDVIQPEHTQHDAAQLR